MKETLLLPNSPMNAPEYREQYHDRARHVEHPGLDVVVHARGLRGDEADRLLFRSFEHFGLLRHLFRWLQFERQLRALDVVHEIDRAITAEPERYPLLTWVGRYLSLVAAPPCGWPPFYAEVVDLLADRFGLRDDPSSTWCSPCSCS